MQPNAYEARGNRSCEGVLQTAINKRTAGRHFLRMTRACYQTDCVAAGQRTRQDLLAYRTGARDISSTSAR